MVKGKTGTDIGIGRNDFLEQVGFVCGVLAGGLDCAGGVRWDGCGGTVFGLGGRSLPME